MKLKRILCILLSLAMLMFTTTVYAGTNWNSSDADDLIEALDGDNIWLVYNNNGEKIGEAEGLRVTIYDAEKETKVYNTIDITGNPMMAGLTNIFCFADNIADGTECIPKTSWLTSAYIGTTYNSIDQSSIQRFHNTVASKIRNNLYHCEYVPALATIDIISENNTANLEAIRNLISGKAFLTDLCSLIDGLELSDFVEGKYKIAFEPLAYMTIAGSAWALTATECGILDKYMLDILGIYPGPLLNKMGPLTHSQLPLSAFLENKDLGISKFSAAESDIIYSQLGNIRYTNSCIIRSMGIGILSGAESPEDEPLTSSVVAEYHTDTDVYTSFTFVNESGADLVSGGTFSIKNAAGETPILSDGPLGEKVVIGLNMDYEYDEEGNIIGATPAGKEYGYLSDEVGQVHVSEDSKIRVFVENPKYSEEEFGVTPYIQLGSFHDGDFMAGKSEDFKYTIARKSTGAVLKSGTLAFSCPDGEEAMGWFEWHTPKSEQDITITIESKNSGVYILDENGYEYNKLVIDAEIAKVEEKTPPDPMVSDKRPSWQKIYSKSSVQDNIAEYAPTDGAQELSWYVWTYDWTQEDWSVGRQGSFKHVISDPDSSMNKPYPYFDAETEKVTYWLRDYGVDNRYYAHQTAANNDKKTGRRYTNAVLLSGEAHKIEYKVSLSADMTIYPSDHCYTATYSNSTDKYTMKSGYGFQIEVNAHLSGDTNFCTGSQTANVLFPEFNYNRQDTALYNRLLEKDGTSFVFRKNEYSTYNDRVHFTPIWYPDNKNYTAYAEVFDVWCPAGQLSIRLTDQMKIKGNVYDDWHIAPVKP